MIKIRIENEHSYVEMSQSWPSNFKNLVRLFVDLIALMRVDGGREGVPKLYEISKGLK